MELIYQSQKWHSKFFINQPEQAFNLAGAMLIIWSLQLTGSIQALLDTTQCSKHEIKATYDLIIPAAGVRCAP
jgi:hypothetical protein